MTNNWMKLVYFLTKVLKFFIILAFLLSVVNFAVYRTINIIIQDPQRSLVFLKTHKTGSDTMQNIIIRYGMKHNLDFALPKYDNYFGYTGTGMRFSISDVRFYKGNTNQKFDLFCHHTRLNYNQISRIMRYKPIFVTILRNSASLFESLYVYTKMDKMMNATLEQFLESPDLIKSLAENRHLNFLGFNQSTFDLGQKQSYVSQKDLDQVINYLDRKFDLVMIMEKYDESLILLKDLMGWSMEDLVYFKTNARAHVKKIKPSVEKKLRQLNSGDQNLYEFFLKRFEEKLQKYKPEYLRSQLESLKDARRKWMDYCIKSIKKNSQLSQSERRGYHDDTLSYELKADIDVNFYDTCNYLTLPSTRLTHLLHSNFTERYRNAEIIESQTKTEKFSQST